MAIDYSAIAAVGGLSKGTPRVLARIERKRGRESALEKAYRLVDDRDGSICWVTGRRLTPGHRSSEYRREHHHLQGRVGDRRHAPHFIVTVSALVHELLTRHVLQATHADTRQPIKFFWNRAMVAPGKEPFRLRRHVNAGGGTRG